MSESEKQVNRPDPNDLEPKLDRCISNQETDEVVCSCKGGIKDVTSCLAEAISITGIEGVSEIQIPEKLMKELIQLAELRIYCARTGMQEATEKMGKPRLTTKKLLEKKQG